MFTVIGHITGSTLFRGSLDQCDAFIRETGFRIVDEAGFAIWVC